MKLWEMAKKITEIREAVEILKKVKEGGN